MLKKLTEVLASPDLRDWIIWRTLHPHDKGRKLRPAFPPYLKIHEAPWTPPTQLLLPILPPLQCELTKGESDVIDLASGPIPRCEFDQPEIFSRLMGDAEDTFAIHRFGWVFSLPNQNVSSEMWIEKKIFDWIDYEPKLSEGWHPYTISERLAHWTLFLCRTRRHEKWSLEQVHQFTESVFHQTHRLLANLEYYEEDLTGNHLSNNGRGLLWAALLTKHRPFAEAGSQIARNEHRRILDAHGMLREGSSHYQFLITRNYFEMWWLSHRLELPELTSELTALLPKMAQCCRMLRLQNQWPHIGDISPDSPPDWFFQVPEAIEMALAKSQSTTAVPAEGWARNFFDSVPAPSDSGSSKIGDFARFDSQGFSVLAHTSSHGHPHLPGHGHCDAGSISVVYKGRPLLIDRGRASYKPSDNTALSTWFHNGLILDNEELEFIPRGVFGPGYLRKRAGEKPRLTIDDGGLELVHHGFDRLYISVRRRFEIQSGQLVIITELNGRGRHQIKLLCHVAHAEAANLTWPEDGSLTIQTGPDPDPRLGTYSTRYGERSHCTSYVWQKDVTLPWTGKIIVLPSSYKTIAN